MKECYTQYYRVARRLREELGLPKSMSIRRVKMDDYDGYCYMWRRRIFIRIDKSLSEKDAIETLQHELAHALQKNFWCRFRLADEKTKDRLLDQSHDAEWGKNYAKVYSVYERNFT